MMYVLIDAKNHFQITALKHMGYVDSIHTIITLPRACELTVVRDQRFLLLLHHKIILTYQCASSI